MGEEEVTHHIGCDRVAALGKGWRRKAQVVKVSLSP
jgi:hypothetical protein